jgi:hypothetical protein
MMIYEELKHLRVVHFTLQVLCITTLYFVFLAWSNIEQLLVEVDVLENFINEARTPEMFRVYIVSERRRDLDHQAKGIRKRIFERMGTLLEITLDESGLALVDSYRIKEGPKPLSFPISSLGTFRDSLFGSAWVMEFVDHLDPININQKEIKSALQGLNGIDTHLSVKTKTWPSAKEPGIIELSVIKVEKRQSYDDFSRREELEPNRYYTVELANASFSFMTHTELWALDAQWFETKFPELQRNWSWLGRLPLEVVKKRVLEEKDFGLPNQKIEVLNLEVRAKDIGILGPILIMCALVYTWGYGRNVASFVKDTSSTNLRNENLGVISPWIGAMKTRTISVVNVFTLIVLPTASVWYSLQMLVGLTLSRFLMPVIVTLLLGYQGYLCGLNIRDYISRFHE